MTSDDQVNPDIDEHVRAVAAKLPFPVTFEADMDGTWSTQIQLGQRGNNPDDPHDRAGVEGPESDWAGNGTWWIDIAGGELQISSDFRAGDDPAVIAEWIATEARRHGSPAAWTAAAAPLAVASMGMSGSAGSAAPPRNERTATAPMESPSLER